jgi:hypothetical protein
MKKNVAGQKIGAQLVSATTGAAFEGAVTVYVTGDAGTQAVGSVGAGACTHEGNGYHTYAPAQAETNYDLIAFTFTGTGAVPVTLQVYTSFPQTQDVASGVAVNSLAANSITATAIANDAITDAKVASDVTIASVTGAVGSVTAGVGLADGAITAAKIATDAITAAKIASGAIDADSLATDATTKLADAFLNRDMATGTDSGSATVRTVRQALRFLRNKFSVTGGTLTVTKEDDSTASWTAAVETTGGAAPVTSMDPAGP